NKRFAEMLGYSSEEMKQLYVWDWDYQIPREQLLDMIKSDNATGKHFETKHRRKDGTIYDVEISTNAAVFAGQKLIFCVCRDITERKRAEQRIKDSEQRYISAEQVGNFGHFSRYLDTDRLVWSAGSYRIFGVDPNQWELTRENAYKIVHPQDLEKLRKANEKAGCGTKGLDTEFRIIRPDGKERVIHAVADVTLDNAGKPERLFGTMQDVTERKQAEEQLKAERDKLQAMMSGLARSGIGIDIVSQDYRVRFQNETLQERFGNIIGKLCYEHYMALKEPCDFCPMVKAIRTNEIESVELTGADGRDYELLAAPLPNPDGTIDQAIEVIRDVTERKQAEEALRENEEKLLRMFESVSEGITVTDLNGIIIEANAELARIHGLSSPSEMLGKSALDWIHPLEHDRALANFKKTMLEDGASGVVQYRLLKADGSDFPGELSTSVLKDASGTPVGFIATTRDITERRQLEEEQQRSARLESIGTLAGGIAHDFNNVLTGILGNISLAKRHVEPKSKADDRLMEAEKASLRARDLTQQLLTFSRGGTPVKKIVSIAELIPDSAGFALRGSNVSGQFSLPDGLWQVEADEGQMHQVITNLVINACEAMPEGGVLNISAENMVIKKKGVLPLPRGNYVAIAIEDHGVGISERHLDRIFEPFFTTKQKGSGLGLATTYSIIRKHDGYITVESTPTIGTTFRIYLPASDKPAPEKEEAVAETPLRGRGKILVMDDEEMIREMLNQMLPPAGYEVELTRDGAEALERYRQAKESGHPFDAVIIDLTVPGGMGGREAIKKLLEIDAGVKAIVSSGYATDPVMANYKEYGFTDIVTKPYSVGDVEKILRNIINEKRRVKGRKSK
ncbi:MAG: PAS domain S-box protein, partial [Dehalococcoidales bacterium]